MTKALGGASVENIVTGKKCSCCGESKTLSDFFKNGNGSTRSECKTCKTKRTRYHRLSKHQEYPRPSLGDIIKNQIRALRLYREEFKNVKVSIPKRAQRKIWNYKNPDKHREIKKNSKYRRRGKTVGSFSETEWRELCDKYDNKCLCCGEKKPLTRDHVIPLDVGGLNVIDNIQPLCRQCNSRKNTKTIDYRRNYANN